jgi:hypothetical protein
LKYISVIYTSYCIYWEMLCSFSYKLIRIDMILMLKNVCYMLWTSYHIPLIYNNGYIIWMISVCACLWCLTLMAVHTTKSRLLSTNTNKMYCYLLKNDFDSRWHISEFVLCLSQLHWIHVRMALRHAVPHNYCFVKFLPYWFLVDIHVYS